jgi:Mg2+-importing ATPase
MSAKVQVSSTRGDAAIASGAYWSRDLTDLMAALGSRDEGLSEPEARRRLRSHGPNAVGESAEPGAARLLLRQFRSPLVLILVFGAAVSLVLRDWTDAFIIIAIVLGSGLLSFFQEYRAAGAMKALRQRLQIRTRAIRNGVESSIPARELVPGDVILLSAGNLVPADAVLIEARDFLVVEASLTGESMPVEKRPGLLPVATVPGARDNCIFLGSSVRSGSARALVVATGRDTAFGDVAALLAQRAPETRFARGVRHFGYLLLQVMLTIVVCVLAANHLMDRPAVDSLLFAVALAVGLSPEMLPAIVSVTLSRGARHMAKSGVIVRRLDAIENLGSIDVVCTDKTGTLTEGVVTLDAVLDVDGLPSPHAGRLAWLNASLETGIDNPLDAAIVRAGEKSGWQTGRTRKVDEIPYDFRRRRLTIVVDDGADTHIVITKGAFDNVLEVCSTVERDRRTQPLDEAERERLRALFESRSRDGFRVLGLAVRDTPPKARYDVADERDMRFVGYLLFVDPPRKDAAQTLHELTRLGLRVKVITGDNRYVAAHIGRAVGLDPGAMLTGAELADMRDEALWQRCEETDFFVEVDPQQKSRIVRALQHRGHGVGYLGDGINDAPALHAADVGISVDQAVDVARQSADLVLLRPNLDVLAHGIREGRRTFANTLKYIGITTSANFGNMISMALGTLFLPFLPLTAKQILLNNFLSDLPSLASATDRVDSEQIASPQRWDMQDIRRFMLAFGLLSTVFDLLTFTLLRVVYDADEQVFQTAWFCMSLTTELIVVLLLRTRRPALQSAPGRMLLWATAAVGLCALLIPVSAPLAAAFDFVPLTTPLVLALAGLLLGYALCNELAKAWMFRRRAGSRADSTP